MHDQVDDKYQYSCENTDNNVHGWISFDSDEPMGFWMITPSNEFRNGGPIKQDLTSHVGPITLSVCPNFYSLSFLSISEVVIITGTHTIMSTRGSNSGDNVQFNNIDFCLG